MKDKRVCFDFEVDFSNGGGIQGQDFRLDIYGDDIADDALAAYIIEDLRLLMVGEVRILNQKIISERHKRASSTTLEQGTVSSKDTYIDLSHVIKDGMVTYKGMPAPLICDHLSHEESRKHYGEGTEFQIGKIEMVANTGTYIDMPYHRYRDGHDLTGLPLEKVSNVPGVVVRLSGLEGRMVDWQSFAATDVRGKAVLIQTNWSAHWGTDQYFEDHVFLSEAAAVYLRDQGAVLVGIDSYNIDSTDGGQRPVHSVLLRADIPIVEHLCHLDALPVDGFLFSAVPPMVQGMGTFPVRAHAVICE